MAAVRVLDDPTPIDAVRVRFQRRHDFLAPETIQWVLAEKKAFPGCRGSGSGAGVRW